jgi:excisionase family DNA binding protein
MTTLLEPQELTTPTEEERQQALETSRILASLPSDDFYLQLVTGQSPAETLSLPAPARRLLYEILRQLAAGHAVSVHPIPAELTTQQAADFLNVSRPYLIKLLDEGEIPSHKVGTHRRVRLADITAYKQEEDARSLAILRELTAEAQEMGFY